MAERNDSENAIDEDFDDLSDEDELDVADERADVEDIDDEDIVDDGDEDVADEANGDDGAHDGDGRAADGDEEGTASTLDLERLEVPVAFNLGHGSICVADLRMLAPGYIFNLDNEAGAEVSIVTGGKVIGQGEIVQIADRLGVRIVRLAGEENA